MSVQSEGVIGVSGPVGPDLKFFFGVGWERITTDGRKSNETLFVIPTNSLWSPPSGIECERISEVSGLLETGRVYEP